MHIRIAPEEVLGLARIARQAPPVISSVVGDRDVIRVVADLRRLETLPGPLRLAVKIAPIVRADVRLASFERGVATLAVEVNAAGLPAHRLLSLAAAPIEQEVAKQGLPPGVVDVQPDARIAVDVERLLDAKVPGLTVTGVAVDDGQVVLDASVA
ncbi:hypothetical protein ACFQBY_04585 [Promicromonospora citrea]|uniref:Uncharacterized protein n=1 Tax=Promicromonospora citrea TaxID=43677 RepID=A0A8H9GH36_9MICO|nr:hypothetical protein [Promicromonospora citrea]GGM25366.1 hypothetical protein GCM10010102_21240 [Promicromonospora citrea]